MSSPRGIDAFQRRPNVELQCTHPTMTRVYDPGLVCMACHQPGPNGWLYACSQDREDLIEQAVVRGEMANFDALGDQLSEELVLRKGSPAAREDKLSFLREISQSERSNYRPDQVATILRQRENVQTTIQLQRLRNNSSELFNNHIFSTSFDGARGPFEFSKPWVCSPQEECQYRVCSRCRPALADRAFLSLNAVANGDIPPTAATGFGFHVLGERPIADADIVRNLGCRSAEAARNEGVRSEHTQSPTQPRPGETMPSSPVGIPGRGFTSQQRPTSTAGAPVNVDDERRLSQRQTKESDSPGSLKHSPRCVNLKEYADLNSVPQFDPIGQPSGTQPLSRGSDVEARHLQCLAAAFAADLSISNNASSTANSPPASGLDPLAVQALPSHRTRQAMQTVNKENVRPPDIELAKTIGTKQEGEPESSHMNAPIHPPDKAVPDDMGKFTASPVKVGHGVALLEESVELGVPDIITHE